MYKPLDLKESSAQLEADLRQYWKEHEIIKKSEDFRKGKPKYIFYEGPPTANGMPGIHHVISRLLKDTVCRLKTMQGFQVKRKAGWDTHGLPVEIEVEKQLGLEDKKAIEAYGVEAFNRKCRESVFTYEKQWREMTEVMGYWIDLDHPYITLENEYIESVWWILDNFFKRGLLYKGYKIVPYCPSCGTPLSSHEVAQGYRDVEDPSVYVKFKAADEENLFYLVWTTTPWTLISNVALAVHPTETYVKVRHKDAYFILAKARLNVLDGEYEVVDEFPGKVLEHRQYEPLFRFVEPEKPAWYIGLADYVTMEDGTGIVHTAPAFGQDDFNLAMKYGLPFVQPVNGEGKFTEAVTPWAGQFVKSADKDIIRYLKENDILYRREQIKHSYPHCWRCDSPLIYYARESWYIRTTQFKDKLIEQNKKIQWYPPFVGEKRFGEWLENNVDWALSRDRFWGTPLNIWICDHCEHQTSIGSIAELKEKGRLKSGKDVPADIELHKPYVDEVVLTCPHCGNKMHRTGEVIDCWFDSGSMPFAQWHFPFEHNDHFFTDLYPADFIAEGIDQTRGWFYSLLAISTLLTDDLCNGKPQASYRRCLVNDLILDKNGQKMSKSRGNSLDPLELMRTYGADAIRWYLLEVSPPWLPTRFNVDEVKEVVSKYILTLKNVYSFFSTYANIDNFTAKDYPLSWQKTAEIDRWIISRLNSLIKKISDWNEQFEFTRSVRALQDFVIDELSNWFVRRSRRRFWSMQMTSDKVDAYLTLYQVLLEVCKLMAPFAPYLSDVIYQNLTGEESVHLVDFPHAEESCIDLTLEEEMQTVIDIVVLGRAARNECQIKVRQPLTAMYLPERVKPVAERMFDLIQEEINIHEIKYVKEDDGFVQYDLKPDFKVMGPKYGKHMKTITNLLTQLNGAEVLHSFNKQGFYEIETEGETLRLTPEDLRVTIRPREGYVFQADNNLFVALDINLTPELIAEGYAREIVNKIQFTRKELGFEIMDRIKVQWFADEDIALAFNKYADYIKNETLTDTLTALSEKIPEMKQYDINGKDVWLAISKIGSEKSQI
ncbi:MAG: isoleucine--tRNA ligase [Candidatus Cloacimonadaceae bacterium]